MRKKLIGLLAPPEVLYLLWRQRSTVLAQLLHQPAALKKRMPERSMISLGPSLNAPAPFFQTISRPFDRQFATGAFLRFSA